MSRYKPHSVLHHGAVAKLGTIPERRVLIETARPLAGVALDLALLGRYDEIENLPRLLLLAICDLRLRNPETSRTEKLHRYRATNAWPTKEIIVWCLLCGHLVEKRRGMDTTEWLETDARLSNPEIVLAPGRLRDHVVPCALQRLAFPGLPLAPASTTRKPPKRQPMVSPNQSALDLDGNP